MAATPEPQDAKQDEELSLLIRTPEDETRWWELQLGFALPEDLYTEIPRGR